MKILLVRKMVIKNNGKKLILSVITDMLTDIVFLSFCQLFYRGYMLRFFSDNVSVSLSVVSVLDRVRGYIGGWVYVNMSVVSVYRVHRYTYIYIVYMLYI